MKRILRAVYRLPLFMLAVRLAAPLARRPKLERPVRFLMRALGGLVRWAHGRRKADPGEAAASLGEAWSQLMPEPRTHFPVAPVAVGAEVAFGEIHVHCPLRGTGDLGACWRLMEFDRSMLRALGGELVVLESQAVSGKDHCRVRIAPAGVPIESH